jgi:hypothetical protein
VVGAKMEVLPSFTITAFKPKVKVSVKQTTAFPFSLFLGDLSEKGTGKIFANKAANTAFKFYEMYTKRAFLGPTILF